MKAAPLLFRLTGIVVLIQLLLGGLLTFAFITALPHIIVGFAVFILAIATMIVSLMAKPSFRPMKAVSVAMVVLILVQIILGFVALGSGGAAIGWLHFANAMAIYGAAISGTFTAMRWNHMAGAVPAELQRQEGVEGLSPQRGAAAPELSSQATRPAVVVLQFLVGGLVTFGGYAFAFFAVTSFGAELGWIHFAVGLLGLLAAFLALTGSILQLRGFLVAINIVTIAYSLFSETLAETESLLGGSDLIGSLIGTLVAVVMSAAILYLVMRRPA
jgi:hypothetical protein